MTGLYAPENESSFIKDFNRIVREMPLRRGSSQYGALCYAFRDSESRSMHIDLIEQAMMDRQTRRFAGANKLECFIESHDLAEQGHKAMMVFVPSGSVGDLTATLVDKVMGSKNCIRLGFDGPT